MGAGARGGLDEKQGLNIRLAGGLADTLVSACSLRDSTGSNHGAVRHGDADYDNDDISGGHHHGNNDIPGSHNYSNDDRPGGVLSVSEHGRAHQHRR
jgi:hypothetical protein